MTESHVLGSSDRIAATGLRVTRQRVAVLDAVGAVPHVSATRVLAAVTARLPAVSHQAVYDCLAHLTEAGLLRRFALGGGPALYETRTRDNHHHCVCRACDAVFDVDCAVGVAPCLDVADSDGFVIDEAEVIYRGLCRACFAARAEPASTVSTVNPGESVNG